MNGFNKKQLMLYQSKWMAIYFGTAFVIMIFLPFPIDLAIAVPVFLLITLYRRKLLSRKLGVNYKSRNGTNSHIKGIKDIKDFFKSISPNASDSTFYGYRHIKYYCISCGNEHKEIACPKCGSKMKRVG
jgi:hypothetical protein